MPENCPCRLSVGFFLAAAVENRLLQLLDPIEPSFRIGQQPVSAMQQSLALAADAKINHVKALRLVFVHPLLLIGRIKCVQPFERRVIIGAERLRGFLSPDRYAALVRMPRSAFTLKNAQSARRERNR